jgi:hypothetical protein
MQMVIVALVLLVNYSFLKINKLNSDGYLYGVMPASQPNSPEWLKNINVDFKIKTEKCLSTLNDNDGLSFNEIADLLEQTYLTPNTEENGN